MTFFFFSSFLEISCSLQCHAKLSWNSLPCVFRPTLEWSQWVSSWSETFEPHPPNPPGKKLSIWTPKVGGSSLRGSYPFWNLTAQKRNLNAPLGVLYKSQQISSGCNSTGFESWGWRFESNHRRSYISKPDGLKSINTSGEVCQEFSCSSACKKNLSEYCRGRLNSNDEQSCSANLGIPSSLSSALSYLATVKSLLLVHVSFGSLGFKDLQCGVDRFFPCLHGFSPGALVSSHHHQKAC